METVPEVQESLCVLLKYHAAQLSRDDEEWSCWGAPYTRMCAAILNIANFTVPPRRAEILSDLISTSVIDSEQERLDSIGEAPGDQTWNYILHSSEYIVGVVDSLRSGENRETIKIFLGLVLTKQFQMGNYDSRARSIMKSVFSLLDLPPGYLFLLESQYCQPSGPYFNKDDVSHIGSAVTPYRSLQVCTVALSTGIVMYGVGLVTAPAVIMAIQQLISTGLISTPAGQMLLGSGVLDTAALMRVLIGMPQLCTSAVACTSALMGVQKASRCMLHRTSPLNHFSLIPLLPPPLVLRDYELFCSSVITEGPGSCTVTKPRPTSGAASCYVVCDKDVDESIYDSDEDIFINSSLVVIEETECSTDEFGLRPVYFLVAGHIGSEYDLREIFGGIPQVDDITGLKPDSDEMTVLSKLENPSLLIEELDKKAESTMDALGTALEEDIEKMGSIMAQQEPGDPVASQFLTEPHLVRKKWWRELFPRGEEYVLQWERTELADLNKKIRNFLEGKLISHAVNAALSHFALTALWGSFSWANLILDEIAELDGPWVVALDRSKQTGRMLARLLLANKFCQLEAAEESKAEDSGEAPSSSHRHVIGSEGVVIVDGESFSWDDCSLENIRRGRPVTLIGYSMGARVIYHCLEELDKCVPSIAGRGIVENVVLMGTPVSTDFDGWSGARRVVSGRLVNCFSRKDWFLALMYRSNMYEPTVAGLQPFSLKRSNKFGIRSVGYCFMMAPGVEVDKDSPRDQEGAAPEVEVDFGSWSEDVECIDVSDIIKSHADYPNQLHAILQKVALEPEVTGTF